MSIYNYFLKAKNLSDDIDSSMMNKSHDEDTDAEELILKKQKFLSLANISDLQLNNLIDSNEIYANWMRIVVLRTLLHTPCLNELKSNNGYARTILNNFLGFKNYEEFAENRNLETLREDLLSILTSWEKEFSDSFVFPEHLNQNLSQLAIMAQLNPLETQVLGLVILIHCESILQHCSEALGHSISAFSVPKILAPLLNVNTKLVEEALDDQSNLIRSGLISLDHRDEGNLRFVVKLITLSFAKRAVMKQDNANDLVKTYVRLTNKSHLSLDNFKHVEVHLNAVKHYLSDAVKASKKGVNILIYGRPGTGKTEFSKLISETIGCALMEVTSTDPEGNPVTPIRRIRSYGLAQSLFHQGETIILFDECEEALSGDNLEFSDNKPTMAQKSWINHTLENNKVPTIWIANSIQHFDHAYIRRFDLCFEMPIPEEQQRRAMMAEMYSDEIGLQLITVLAKNKNTSPALVANTAKVIKILGKDKTELERNNLALMLINDKLRAQSGAEIKLLDQVNFEFNPEMINCSVNLEALQKGIKQHLEARICIYGPPGTGKTAFGKWLADSLSIQHIILKPSDLLGSHVGETEKNIAEAFHRASKEKALLQFDEVDTFLITRTQAQQSWEISMVNEMLTQMENFKGIFIASTNLFENLDEAALRRFDINLKFDFMPNHQAWLMFLETCSSMQLTVDESVLLPRFKYIHNLTPGDFAQVVRQSRFIPPESANDLLSSLIKSVEVKRSSTSKNMGFLKAA